ncbi:MAG: divalent cation tolerance protein CutA [Candidatus Lokiarchaeota archaeon]|nr:divalent cation tolerance protein CutA [Candidatus Lokiarchaeota archaeon]MBD3338415.1 divalent cation tolerance protein CutA [Candidatus Lokiarchaeota archaeon]
MEYFLFLVTVPSIEEGKKIAKHLVNGKFAACVNIVKDIVSVYTWENKIHEDNEHLLLIKTTEDNSEKIIKQITKIHSYDTPECIGFEISKASEKYLNWIKDVVT